MTTAAINNIRARLGASYPFAGRYLDVDGLAYHYLEEGRGAPVVMVHGNPTWSFYFRHLIRDLAPDFRCIAPDHMGCGLSAKPRDSAYPFTLDRRVADFGRLMNHLQLEGIHLVLHDWGGMIGLAWAMDHLDRVASLTITNTAGFFPPGNKRIPRRLWLIRNLTPFAVPAVLGLNLFARGAVWMAARKSLSKEARQGLLAPYDTPRHRLATLRFVQDIPLFPGDPGHATVARVSAQLERLADRPLLILWGRHDFVFDTDYYAEWRRRFPQAPARLFDDAGHYLFEDQPRRTTAMIRTFLESIQTAHQRG
ncbi:MAG: alpha/beta fold hydrolase [Desulfosarcinaceae bacterium]|nr:alpha/beta fold hydrolase [Desulfosarcinaceae bacterium]